MVYHANHGQGDWGILLWGAVLQSGITRLISADTIVPDPKNPQTLNRYAYAYNNPVNYTDPSGHASICAGCDGIGLGGIFRAYYESHHDAGRLLNEATDFFYQNPNYEIAASSLPQPSDKYDAANAQSQVRSGAPRESKLDTLIPTTAYAQINVSLTGFSRQGPGGVGDLTASLTFAWNFRKGQFGLLFSTQASAGIGVGSAPIGASATGGTGLIWGASSVDSLTGTSFQASSSLGLPNHVVLGFNGSRGTNSDGSLFIDPISHQPVTTLGPTFGATTQSFSAQAMVSPSPFSVQDPLVVGNPPVPTMFSFVPNKTVPFWISGQ